MKLKSSMSMTRLSLSIVSLLSLASWWRETNTALASEWASMFSTSSCESSGSMGIAILPKAVAAKNATLQLGLFSESIATLSLAPIPKLESTRERLSQVSRNCP